MYTQVGLCLKCGAPIYAPTVWHGIFPPPSRPSCNCATDGKESFTWTTTFIKTVNGDCTTVSTSLTEFPSRSIEVRVEGKDIGRWERFTDGWTFYPTKPLYHMTEEKMIRVLDAIKETKGE